MAMLVLGRVPHETLLKMDIFKSAMMRFLTVFGES